LHSHLAGPIEKIAIETALGQVDDPSRRHLGVSTLMRLLYTAHALVESKLPVSTQGSYLPLQEPFTVLRAVRSVVERANTELFVVDPYLTDSILDQVVAQSGSNVAVRLLMDSKHAKERRALAVGVEAWKKQSVTRFLEARATPPKGLHDRMVVVDKADVWLVSQSFDALAKNSPGSIQRADSAIATEKVDFLEDLWERSERI